MNPTNLSIGSHFGVPVNHQHAIDNQSGMRWSFQQMFQVCILDACLAFILFCYTSIRFFHQSCLCIFIEYSSCMIMWLMCLLCSKLIRKRHLLAHGLGRIGGIKLQKGSHRYEIIHGKTLSVFLFFDICAIKHVL